MLWPWGVEAETARDIPGQIRCGTGAGELQVVSLDHWTCFSGFRSDCDCLCWGCALLLLFLILNDTINIYQLLRFSVSYRVTDVTVNISSVHQSSFSVQVRSQWRSQWRRWCQDMRMCLERCGRYLRPCPGLKRDLHHPAPSCCMTCVIWSVLTRHPEVCQARLWVACSSWTASCNGPGAWNCHEFPTFAYFILLGCAFQSVSGL